MNSPMVKYNFTIGLFVYLGIKRGSVIPSPSPIYRKAIRLARFDERLHALL